MTQNLKLTCALAIGLLGGATLSHYLSPISVFAQSQIFPKQVPLMTGLGTRLADFDSTQGTIKLVPVVTLQIHRTDRTITLELGPGPESNSK
jgi:hypothetical protein